MENDKQELQFNPESMDCTIRGLESMIGEIAKRPIGMSESAKTPVFLYTIGIYW